MNPHYVAAANEFQIPIKTALGISKVQFSPSLDKRLLLVASWDSYAKIFDLTNPNNALEVKNIFHKKPVLCCAFAGPGSVITGGLDEIVKLNDVETSREISMGQHSAGVRCLEYCANMRTAISGGWDAAIKLWDIRSQSCVGQMECSDKIYAMDVINNTIVAGTKDKQIFIWDVRNTKDPIQVRESPLKFQLRSIKCFPSAEAFVVSSIEGRVAVEYFDLNPEIQKSKYAFKCHRVKSEQGELIYPVNALAFHPIHRTFATGGSDQMVNMWDPFNRKRLCQFRKFPSSVTSLSFTQDGSMLAIASTYLYEDEVVPNPLPEPSLTVRKMTELEVKPK